MKEHAGAIITALVSAFIIAVVTAIWAFTREGGAALEERQVKTWCEEVVADKAPDKGAAEVFHATIETEVKGVNTRLDTTNTLLRDLIEYQRSGG